MSSWQPYVDSLTSAGVEKAAIYDTQGNLEASSPGFALSPEEFNALHASFVDPSSAFEKGIQIAGIRYVALRAESDKQYGRKGAEGVVVARTAKTFVIGVHGEARSTNETATVVEGLAEQLRGTGY
ncbi:profilin [Streptomyces nojiriensis]|uniref:profilin n=1 Tax=Streptomyces nojiriensis TaxID=66374 RepID=UPI0035DAEAAF